MTTTAPEKRLQGHIERSRDEEAQWHTVRWIRSLNVLGLKPEIEVVRKVDIEFLAETEIFCIAEFRRLGCDLTNTAAGGVGGVTRNRTSMSVERLRKFIAESEWRGSAWRGKTQPQSVIDARMAGYTPEKREAAIAKGIATRARRAAVARAFGVELYSRPSPRKGKVLTDKEKEVARAGAKAQWANYTSEEAEAHKQRLRDDAEKFRERIRNGEIDHPAKGNKWSVGVKRDPETHIKVWQTRRAAGFISQQEMLEKVAAEAGESVSKTTRALKGQSHKVAAEAREKIWVAYHAIKEQIPNLTVVYPEKGI